MEPFKIHILGCGSALPTLRHNTSSQVVEIRGKLFMVDCGEGTQTQMRRLHISYNRLSAVLLTHIHGDHCFGLIGMICTFGLLGRKMPLHIYAPKEMKSVLDILIEKFCRDLGYDVVFHDVDTTRRAVIYEDRSLKIETLPLEHRVPCAGFLFTEKPGLPHIRRDMTDFYNIPVSQINNIKNGADWTDSEGNVIPNSRLTRPAGSPRSYAYCSDTRYLPSLHRELTGVSAMYHEATYLDGDEKSAEQYCHSTARQAAMVARDAGAGKLLIGHFSSRHTDEQEYLRQAQEVFADTILADEGMVYEIK